MAETGWTGRHLVLKAADGHITGIVPCYRKRHSYGEYVFDHGWADAFSRAGGRYYPKLQCAVPFYARHRASVTCGDPGRRVLRLLRG